MSVWCGSSNRPEEASDEGHKRQPLAAERTGAGGCEHRMSTRNGRGQARDKTCVCYTGDLQGQDDPVPPEISILSCPQAPCIGQGSRRKQNDGKRFIIRNRFTQLWRHRSPALCHVLAGVRDGWRGKFHSEHKRKPMSQPKKQFGKRANSPLFHLLVLVRPPTDWMRPTQVREGNLLYSVYGFKCSQKHPHTHPE